MKQHSLHHSISICEVKLKILMETHEALGRLPVWRNKLCGPCFVLCCACFSPFFQLLGTVWRSLVWQVAVQNSSRSVLVWSIRTKQSINSKLHLMPRKSEFLLWKIPGALSLIQFVERNWIYAIETRDVNTLCGNQILFLNLLVFFKFIHCSSILRISRLLVPL
jgi:hypothetical protein